MHDKDWILTLPLRADKMHPVPCTEPEAKAKRPAHEMVASLLEKENAEVAIQVKVKKARTAEGLVRGRPLLQDVLNSER